MISGALVLLKGPDAFNLTALQSESVVSAAVLGAIVGAALSSCGNHVCGRKPVILLSSLLFTLGSVLMGLATTFPALLAGRLAVGVGIGFSSMTVPLYIAEVSPPHVRGRLVSLNTLLVTGGQFFACVLAALLSRVPNGWRYMLGLAAVPAGVQFVGFLLLPESPRYLLSKGSARSKEAAWAALVRIRGTPDVEAEFAHIESELKRTTSAKLDVWQELRSPSVVRALTLGCFLQALQQLCGINTVMYYGATIVQMAGFADPSTAIWLAAVVSFSNFLFTFVGIYLVDRAGRRLLTLASLAGVVLSLLALGASFYAAEALSAPVTRTGDSECGAAGSCFSCVASAACGFCSVGTDIDSATVRNVCVPGTAVSPTAGGVVCAVGQWAYASCPRDSSGPGVLILATLFIYLACFASGMGCMPWTINAEIYPLRVRSFALSLSTSVNWVANLLVSFTFLSVIDALAPHGAFWLYALLAALGFAFLWRELPETKGLALEEVQRIFERRHTYEKIAERRPERT